MNTKKKNNTKTQKQNKLILYILIRYILILISSLIFLGSLFINLAINIYTYLSYYFLKFITDVTKDGLNLLVEDKYVFIVDASCIAPSVYLLLSILILSVPLSNLILNLKILGKALLLFSLFNLFRIFLLMIIHVFLGIEWFDKLHLLFYELMSGIGTAIILIYLFKKEKIKNTYPIYSDIKNILNLFNKK